MAPFTAYCRGLVGPKRILFLQHAGALGGSCVSLQVLLQNLDRSRFEPVVALLRESEEVLAYHRAAGCEIVPWPGIETFEHTTAEWAALGHPWGWPGAARSAWGWNRSRRRTVELLERVRPALVHLNSAVLSPSAAALRDSRLPFVWHVRESPPPGGAAWTRWLGRALARWPSVAIFMTPLSRRMWNTGGEGEIVPESVDLSRFSPNHGREGARDRLGIPAEARVVLYVGGLPEIKGIRPLLGALAALRRRDPGIVCLMPGAEPSLPSPLARTVRTALTAFGMHSPGEQLERALASLGDACRVSRFSEGVADMLAASDVLAFPAVRDHFARPVMEAFAAGRPVVASRLPLLQEMVSDGETGSLVNPGDPAALAAELGRLLADSDLRRRMGAAGRVVAEALHDARRNTDATMKIYDRILAGRDSDGR